jgi:hypothetical protein
MWTASGFDDTYGYRRVFESSLSLSFWDTHLPRVLPRTFDPTFITIAFDRSSSDWFETCFLVARKRRIGLR